MRRNVLKKIPDIDNDIQRCKKLIIHTNGWHNDLRKRIHTYICDCISRDKGVEVCKCDDCECYEMTTEKHLTIPDHEFNDCPACMAEHYNALLKGMHTTEDNCFLGGAYVHGMSPEYVPLCPDCLDIIQNPRMLKMAKQLNAILTVPHDEVPYLSGYLLDSDDSYYVGNVCTLKVNRGDMFIQAIKDENARLKDENAELKDENAKLKKMYN